MLRLLRASQEAVWRLIGIDEWLSRTKMVVNCYSQKHVINTIFNTEIKTKQVENATVRSLLVRKEQPKWLCGGCKV